MSPLNLNFSDGDTLYANAMNLIVAAINALQKAVGKKVDKEEGKRLSSNDFTNEHKDNLEKIPNFRTADNGDVYIYMNGQWVNLSEKLNVISEPTSIPDEPPTPDPPTPEAPSEPPSEIELIPTTLSFDADGN